MNISAMGKHRSRCLLPGVLGWLVLLSPSAWALSGVALDNPLGGWHRSGLPGRTEETAVAYPYSPIDRGAQTGRTLIQGRLQGMPKDARKAPGSKRPPPPPTLVVNGNPMPLYSDEEGRFSRPYVLGPGSNSIEIRDAEGRPLRRLQFYEANGDAPRADLRVIVAWDDNQAEVDLHVLTPDGQHAFFANPVLSQGGGMDVDSVDGAGPEMFSVAAPQRGAYQLYVNYWGNFGAEGYHFDENTRQKKVITCRVTVVYHENTPQEKRESFVVPLRKIGDLTHVRTIFY